MTNEEWLEEAQELYPGWYKIIQRLDKHLNIIFANGYKIDQIKEKFGTLRFYWSAPEGAAHVDMKDARISVVNIEGESARTCMLCGEAARTRTDVSWHCTLCDDCFGKQYPNKKETMERYKITYVGYADNYLDVEAAYALIEKQMWVPGETLRIEREDILLEKEAE